MHTCGFGSLVGIAIVALHESGEIINFKLVNDILFGILIGDYFGINNCLGTQYRLYGSRLICCGSNVLTRSHQGSATLCQLVDIRCRSFRPGSRTIISGRSPP